jgi:catechol 2,3-dioxygenase-like lactoylglutathione lyase family enzyme
MIDHYYLKTANYARSKAFYSTVLTVLGRELIMEFPGLAGFGYANTPPKQVKFFVAAASPAGTVPESQHLAFRCDTSAEVDAFHAAAIVAGATDNGSPGIRGHFHAKYYAAYVLDPDGHNIEAVCHDGEDA